MNRAGIALALLLVLLAAWPAYSQAANDAAVNGRVHTIAAQLRCPVCQGLSLADSQSELSQQMRDVIREQVIAGRSDAQIIDYFVAKYGEWILLEPRPRGFNLLAYMLPMIVLAAGIAVIYASVRKWTGAPAEAKVPVTGNSE